MADFNVTVTVTRHSNGHFSWSFDGGPLQFDSVFATVPEDTTKTIEITLQAATSGDSVIFRNTPLEFTTADNTPIGVPSHFSVPSGGSSSITITDDNDPAPSENDPVHFRLLATYTPSGESGIHIHSPDPTIVNAGTGGREWIFPKS